MIGLVSHPRHPNQADKMEFEAPQDPLWLRDLRNVLRFRNSRLQLLAMKFFFSHTAMVSLDPEGYIYMSLLKEK